MAKSRWWLLAIQRSMPSFDAGVSLETVASQNKQSLLGRVPSICLSCVKPQGDRDVPIVYEI
jgi:hypothetical protein